MNLHGQLAFLMQIDIFIALLFADPPWLWKFWNFFDSRLLVNQFAGSYTTLFERLNLKFHPFRHFLLRERGFGRCSLCRPSTFDWFSTISSSSMTTVLYIKGTAKLLSRLRNKSLITMHNDLKFLLNVSSSLSLHVHATISFPLSFSFYRNTFWMLT